MKVCHKCGEEWNGINQPGARAYCTKCSADLHVCFNCRFYDPAKSNKCQVNDAEAVVWKDKANYCEDFQFTDKKAEQPESGAGGAKKRWENLFKKKDS